MKTNNLVPKIYKSATISRPRTVTEQVPVLEIHEVDYELASKFCMPQVPPFLEILKQIFLAMFVDPFTK